MNVKQAYDACERVIAKNSRSFHKTFALLPSDKRKAVWAVYTFCRTADDIVDEGHAPHEELPRFRQEFRAFLAGDFDRTNAMWVALDDVFQRYDMDEEPFLLQLEGQEMDLVKHRYETMDELLEYCFHVASTVGLMLLPILAPGKKEKLVDGAVALGYGMQLTNILRDIGHDLSIGRIYLPADLMAKHGVTEASLRCRVVDDSFIALWEELAGMAESYYKESFKTISHYPLSSRVPVEGSGLVYREILSAIRKKHYDVFERKHFVPDASKQAILSALI